MYNTNMKIYSELNENFHLSLALGFFDGVHLGHKKVIESAVNFAKKNGNKSAIITFKEHPYCYLHGVCPKYIVLNKVREDKFKELGIDYVYELNFEDISKFSAAEYFKDILIKYFKPVSISTGWNHYFGENKSGNSNFLKNKSSQYGYEYFETEPVKFNNEIINSTSIRKYLSEGKIEKANKMLGYNFSVNGKVVKGNQIGRTIGFKTANITYPSELIEIPYGVYSVNTNFGKAIANFGIRPTVNGSKPILEVHILNFDQDIYGEQIDIEFFKMLRTEIKFSSIDELKVQILKDILSI